MIEETGPPPEETALLKTFWTEMIKNRRVVKQAKNHLINKLSKQAKKIGENDKKNKKESLVDQISATKTLFADDVTKFCFLQPWSELQQHFKTATTKDDLAKIKLCLTKPLKKATEDFQTKCPEWGKINFLLEEHGKYKKKKFPKKKRSKERLSDKSTANGDPRFAPELLNDDEFSQFRPAESEKEGNDSLERSIASVKPEELKKPKRAGDEKSRLGINKLMKKEALAVKEEKDVNLMHPSRSAREVECRLQGNVEESKVGKSGKQQEHGVRSAGSIKRTDSIVSKRLNNKRKNSETVRTKSSSFTVESDDEIVSRQRPDDESEPLKKKRNPGFDRRKPVNPPENSAAENTLTVDPFFIASGSREYLTHATLEKPSTATRPDSVRGDSTGNNNRSSNTGGARNRRERRALERKPTNDLKFSKNSSQSRVSVKPNDVGEKLHPSWQAKKSLAAKIMPFQDGEKDDVRNTCGMYLQAFREGIIYIYDDLYLRLNEIETECRKDPDYSVLSLAVEIDPFLYIFKAVSDAINRIHKQKIGGCFILDLCQSYMNHGAEPVQNAFEKIHAACLRPFYLQTNTWILNARLYDPYNEFFIKNVPKEDSELYNDTETESVASTTFSCDLIDEIESNACSPSYGIALERLPTFLPYSVASKMLFIGEMVLICKRGPAMNTESINEIVENCGLDFSELNKKLQDLEKMDNFSLSRFDNVITDIWADINKYARKLADEAGVKNKIIQMKDIYLFGRGELWQEFISRCNLHLNSEASNVKSRNFKIEFDNALYYVYLTDDSDLSEMVDFKLPRREDLTKGVKARHVLEIDTKITWPLRSIFTPEVMNNYNIIFRFLLNLRKSVMALHRSWFLINKFTNLQIQFKFVELKTFLLALMSNLENYCFTEVIANRMSWLSDKIDNSTTYTEINTFVLEFQRDVLSRLFLTREDDVGNNDVELEMTQDFENATGIGSQEGASVLVHIMKQVRSCLRSLLMLGEKFALLAEKSSFDFDESHMDLLTALKTRLVEKIKVLFKLSQVDYDSPLSSSSHVDQLILCLDYSKFFRDKYSVPTS